MLQPQNINIILLTSYIIILTKRKLKTVTAKSSAFAEEHFPEDLIEIAT